MDVVIINYFHVDQEQYDMKILLPFSDLIGSENREIKENKRNNDFGNIVIHGIHVWNFKPVGWPENFHFNSEKKWDAQKRRDLWSTPRTL